MRQEAAGACCQKRFEASDEQQQAKVLFIYTGNYLPLPQGVLTPETFFDIPQHRPPLEVLRVLTRTLIRSMLFSAIGA